MKRRLILTSLIVLAFSLTLAGCEGGAREGSELAEVKAALEKTQQELANVKNDRNLLQEQVVELIRTRNEAVNEVKNSQDRINELTRKFEEQSKIIRELQEHMKKMQAAIEKL
jgi:peptidoglycan hydrolase CwlO-like protein